MSVGAQIPGEALVAAAALAAIRLSQGRTGEESALLAAFFTLLGDNLALLSLGRAAQQEPDG